MKDGCPPADRNRKTLSQLGRFNQRQRISQRPIDPSTGRPLKRTVLDTQNERHGVFFLHPTKGWRMITPKRSAAAIITAEVKAGMEPFSLRRWRRRLKAASS